MRLLVIQVNKVRFLAQMSIFMLGFAALAFLKDYFMVSFLGNIKNIQSCHTDSHRMLYEHLKLDTYVKRLLRSLLLQDGSYQQELDVLQGLVQIDPAQIFERNYQLFKDYDPAYQQFVQQLATSSICSEILPLTQLLQDRCAQLNQKILNLGYVNFFLDYLNFIKSQLNTITIQLQTNTVASLEALFLTILNDEKIVNHADIIDFIEVLPIPRLSDFTLCAGPSAKSSGTDLHFTAEL